MLEEELLVPLNRVCLVNDDYTRQHATEAISELLTLKEIQVQFLIWWKKRLLHVSDMISGF